MFRASPSLLLLLLFLSSATITFCNYPAACPTRTCGGVPINYPFWFEEVEGLQQGKGDTFQPYCGYKNFTIRCIDESPVLSLDGDVNYTVTKIDYEQKKVVLGYTDVLSSPGNCPRVRHNDTFWDLNNSPFNYTEADDTLTFFFNCSLLTTPILSIRPITCLSARSPTTEIFSYVFLNEDIPPEINYLKCDEKVTAAVLSSELADSMTALAENFASALKKGFELGWTPMTADGCSICEKNGGFCGYNVTGNGSYSFTCHCSDGSQRTNCNSNGNFNNHKKRKIIEAGTLLFGGLVISSFLIVLGFVRYLRNRRGCLLWKKTPNDARAIESFLQKYDSLVPKRYTYAEVKKMTKSLNEKLGQGGFGSVFKGNLPDGRQVAVKILNISNGNGEDFVNEVASIGKTSHVNVVTLLGFCSESSKRALIYDFMSNGSLDKHIRNAKVAQMPSLSCEKLYEIAIGIARGLEYLHRGSNTRMVHFDIKPHNILLDKDLRPKISDFGLAKLCSSKGSIVSINGTRGTPGYIAPEVFSRSFGVVSSKSDVYSYGMMILEIFEGKDKCALNNEEGSEDYFPNSIYKTLLAENHEISTHSITNASSEIIRKMLVIGLWCIQTMPENRPSMQRVIEMLEGGSKDLPVPPKPLLISSPVNFDFMTMSSSLV